MTKLQRVLGLMAKKLVESLKFKKVVVQGNELADLKKPEIERCQKQVNLWIQSVKPKKMPHDLERAWNEAVNSIIKNADTFTGYEYLQIGRRDPVLTKQEVEYLSQICKMVTNHVIPRDAKRNISMWAVELGKHQKEIQQTKPVEKLVKTDFYNGSVQFDALFSKAKHGYWQSSCEMFARAFDCYIADKIKASGERSDYHPHMRIPMLFRTEKVAFMPPFLQEMNALRSLKSLIFYLKI